MITEAELIDMERRAIELMDLLTPRGRIANYHSYLMTTVADLREKVPALCADLDRLVSLTRKNMMLKVRTAGGGE
jgi:hypothetical protein